MHWTSFIKLQSLKSRLPSENRHTHHLIPLISMNSSSQSDSLLPWFYLRPWIWPGLLQLKEAGTQPLLQMSSTGLHRKEFILLHTQHKCDFLQLEMPLNNHKWGPRQSKSSHIWDSSLELKWADLSVMPRWLEPCIKVMQKRPKMIAMIQILCNSLSSVRWGGGSALPMVRREPRYWAFSHGLLTGFLDWKDRLFSKFSAWLA